MRFQATLLLIHTIDVLVDLIVAVSAILSYRGLVPTVHPATFQALNALLVLISTLQSYDLLDMEQNSCLSTAEFAAEVAPSAADTILTE